MGFGYAGWPNSESDLRLKPMLCRLNPDEVQRHSGKPRRQPRSLQPRRKCGELQILKENRPPTENNNATWMTCGGFKPFEHQWAMADAFRFLRQIGRKRIAERTYALNDQCKGGLDGMKGISLHTPKDHRLSAGLICFDIDGMRPEEVSRRLLERKIIMTKTPYGRSYARLAPSILSSPEEIETVFREIRAMAPA
jgi:selenocysteine lyase/cysteine desulfurase